jgi:hypothetical protein
LLGGVGFNVNQNSTQPNNTYRAYVGLQFQQPDYVGLHRLRSLCNYHITYIVIRFFVMSAIKMHRTKLQQRLPTNNKEIDPKMHLHNGKRISEPKRKLKDNNMQPSNRVSVKRVRIDPPDNDEDIYVSSHHTRYPARDNFATSIDDSPDENSYSGTVVC